MHVRTHVQSPPVHILYSTQVDQRPDWVGVGGSWNYIYVRMPSSNNQVVNTKRDQRNVTNALQYSFSLLVIMLLMSLRIWVGGDSLANTLVNTWRRSDHAAYTCTTKVIVSTWMPVRLLYIHRPTVLCLHWSLGARYEWSCSLKC